jgi:hypothetical protein
MLRLKKTAHARDIHSYYKYHIIGMRYNMLRLENKHHRRETYEDGREGKISCQYRTHQCQLLIKERGNNPRTNRSGLHCKNQTNKDWIRPWNPIINQRRMGKKGDDWFFTCE